MYVYTHPLVSCRAWARPRRAPPPRSPPPTRPPRAFPAAPSPPTSAPRAATTPRCASLPPARATGRAASPRTAPRPNSPRCATNYPPLRFELYTYLGTSGPNLELGTMRVHVTNGGLLNGLNIARKVGPCPRSRRRWVLGSVRAFSEALHAENTYRPWFQVRTQPFYLSIYLSIYRSMYKENNPTPAFRFVSRGTTHPRPPSSRFELYLCLSLSVFFW